jgi:hypothetical protein
MLHAHTPGARPHFLESFEEPRSRERDLIFASVIEGVVPERLGRVGYVEVDDIVPMMSRNCLHYALCQVAVRIDEHHSAAVQNVLHCERLDKRRFTGSRLPDDLHMRMPVGLLDADRHSFISKVRAREK